MSSSKFREVQAPVEKKLLSLAVAKGLLPMKMKHRPLTSEAFSKMLEGLVYIEAIEEHEAGPYFLQYCKETNPNNLT